MKHPPTHRCSQCDVNWPSVQAYEDNCPLCLRPTWQTTSHNCLTHAQANARILAVNNSKRLYVEFERFYAERAAEQFRAELDAFAGVA